MSTQTLPAPAPTPALGRMAASALAAGALLAVALPSFTGASWGSVTEVLGTVEPWQLLGLTVLWLAGLAAYSVVLAASLPGLSRRQGFVLNLVGSGVSNLVPFGGAVGVGVTWAMLRQYGFGHAAAATYTAVTGVWNLLARLALPAAGVAALLLVGARVPAPVLAATAVGALAGLAVLAAVVLVLADDRVVERAAGALGRAVRAGQRALHRPESYGVAAEVVALRAQVAELVRTKRSALTGGMLAYVVLQGVLMWACLAVVGSDLGWAQVVAGYACGRLLTAVVLTPGGTGFAETGAAAVLVALGGDPSVAVAGVLLFSVFTFVLEIPGGAAAYGWHVLSRRRAGVRRAS